MRSFFAYSYIRLGKYLPAHFLRLKHDIWCPMLWHMIAMLYQSPLPKKPFSKTAWLWCIFGTRIIYIYIYIHGCSVVRGQSFHHLKLLWISLDDIELAVWFWVLHFHLGSWSPSGSYFWDRWLNHQADTSANVRVISGGLFHGGNPDLLGLVGLWSQHLQDH